MFDQIRKCLSSIIGCCDTMAEDNIVEKLSEIRATVAQIQLELEELEYQNSED